MTGPSKNNFEVRNIFVNKGEMYVMNGKTYRPML